MVKEDYNCSLVVLRRCLLAQQTTCMAFLVFSPLESLTVGADMTDVTLVDHGFLPNFTNFPVFILLLCGAPGEEEYIA